MDKLFTTKEAADFFGVTTKTVKNWRKSGKLVPCQTGENGYSLYSTEQLGKFKAQLGKKIQTGENQTRESQTRENELQTRENELQTRESQTRENELQTRESQTRENELQTRENELQTRELGNLQLGNFPTSTGESGERKLGNFPTLQTRENDKTRELGNLQLGNFPTSTGESGERKLGNFPTLQTRENDKTREKVGKQTRETGERNFDAEYLRLIESDIANAQQHLDELPEPDRRGLTLATLRHFHCGYNPAWVLTKSRAELSCGLYLNDNVETKHLPPPSPRIIIPTASRSHFNAVATNSARRSIDKRFWKQHAGKMTLFFDTDTNLNSDTVFIVEGEFDAMSIWQASGGKIAVAAILGCDNWKRTLLPKLPDLRDKRLILLLDADTAGNKAAKRLLNELLQRGIPAVRKSLFHALHKDEQNFFGRKVDANDLLKTRGNDYLNQMLVKIIESSTTEFDALANKIKQPNPFADGSDPDILVLPSKKSARHDGTIKPSNYREEIRLILTDFVHAKDLSRDEWCAVGMILKRYGFELADFDAWSRDDSRYDANDCKAQWDSFKTDGELGDGGYKIGTLIELAKKSGYEPQRAISPIDKSLSLSAEQRAFLFGGDFSDLDNARRIEYLHGNHIRFVTNRSQWIIFKNGLWTFSDEGNSAILPDTTDLADKLIANADTEDEFKIGIRLKMAQHRESAIKTLRGIVSVRITTDDLNRHNNLLNCKNGVVDLQTGKFYDDVDPKLLLTQQCNAIYKSDYHNETVDKFFRDILPDEPTRAALIRFLAYATTGECSEERALFCNGDGGNGKGTLTKTTLLLFGSYATTLKTSAVLLTGRTQDAGAATTELNPLEDCRLAIVEELPQGGKLDVAKFKNLTGGDLIPIRRLHQEQTTIEPHFSPILSGNYLPELSDTRDPGLLRRLMNIHFTQSFTGDKRNPHLKEQLASPDALSGFISLIINDAKFWYREGLIESDAMKQATRDYLNENDFISEFISEHCTRRSDLAIPRKQFLERLKNEYSTECLRLFNNRDRALVDAICRINGISYKRGTGGGYQFFGVGWRNNAMSDYEWQGITVDPDDLPI